MFGRKLECTQPFDVATISLVVPRAGPMPGILRIFRSFDHYMGLLILFSSAILSFYFYIRKYDDPILRTFRLLIHQQMENISDRIPDRILAFAWIFWAFVICTAAQSHLIKDLTDSPFYRSIDTLEELAESGFTLMVDEIHLRSLNNSGSEVKSIIAENAVREPDFAECMKLLVSKGNVACGVDGIYAQGAVDKSNRESRVREKREHRSSTVGYAHVAGEVLTQYWRVIIVKEGFPYLDKFNEAYSIIMESGLINHWALEDVWYLVLNKFRNRGHREGGSKRHVLNLNHFEGIFKVLLIGCGIAVGIFVGEIFYYRIKRRANVT